MVDKLVFKKQTEEYLNRLDPQSEYIKQASIFISKSKGIPVEEARKKVIAVLKSYPIKNPIVKFNHRAENGDMFIDTEPLLSYIKSVQDEHNVLVPSFTAYVHPSIKKSLHAEFISVNIKARKEDKKKLFYYTQTGDKDKAMYYDNMQKTRKIFNNSLSGAYASKSTILYNPSAHYTLTSVTRCVSSIGNAVTESIISGNKIFRDPDSVLNYISSVLANADMEALQKVIDKYGIVYPEVSDVMLMVKESTENFWNIPSKLDYIREYLGKLSKLELAAVLYTNDLLNFRRLNKDIMVKLIARLSSTKTGYTTPETELKDIENVQEGVQSHVHNICQDAIKGKVIEYDKMVGSELLDLLASTAKYVAEGLTEYKDLIQALLITKVGPINIAYIKELMRKCIVLSDTDSTCATYDDWTRWYKENCNGEDRDPIGVASTMMTIATQTMDHYIKTLSGNMNLDKSKFETLKMKNEFMWNSFVTMNASKHYFADVSIKEGNVLREPKAEIKGVHLLASSISAEYRNAGHGMMDEIRATLREHKKLDLYSYVKRVADIEREIIAKIKTGSTEVLGTDKIKDPTSYKDAPEKSPYIHHLLWKEVFADKYGYPGEPTYNVVKVPTNLDTEARMNTYLESLEDQELANRFRNFLKKYGKKNIGTFRPPMSLIEGKGLPDEIFNCVNYKRIVKDNCGMMYVVLEALGFYKSSDVLISELGY